MCLSYTLKDNDKQEILDSMSDDDYINVYKIVEIHYQKIGSSEDFSFDYMSPYLKYWFEEGLNVIKAHDKLLSADIFPGDMYKAGFHFFAKKEDAENFTARCRLSFIRPIIIIEVKIKKSWITEIGMDGLRSGQLTYVTNRAEFPKVDEQQAKKLCRGARTSKELRDRNTRKEIRNILSCV